MLRRREDLDQAGGDGNHLDALPRVVRGGAVRWEVFGVNAVVPVQQSFELDRAAEAMRTQQTEHIQGKLGLAIA